MTFTVLSKCSSQKGVYAVRYKTTNVTFVVIPANQQGYDNLVVLALHRPMRKTECTRKCLGPLVGMASLETVMDVRGKLFHLSRKSEAMM